MRGFKWTTWLLGAGCAGLTLAYLLDEMGAYAATVQVWPAFVLVAGLLLVGLVVEQDGIFGYLGGLLARVFTGGLLFYSASMLLVVIVTAFLNLDTSVAFLTPILIYAAKSRGDDEAPLLYGCLLLSNSGSLFLPGSNLTNLIVWGGRPGSGAVFLRELGPTAAAAGVITALVVGVFFHRLLSTQVTRPAPPTRPTMGLGLVLICAVTVIIIVLPHPAPVVGGCGLFAAALRSRGQRSEWAEIWRVLGARVLLGLFGVSVAFGALGRSWRWVAHLESHLNLWGTAALGAATSIAVNNLPAASLLSARVPPHPLALLVGLNLGPNFAITGSLAWFLWLRTARASGAKPSLKVAMRVGATSALCALVGALLVLNVTGSS